MYWRNCKQLLMIMVWAITVFIPSHLWYTCIVLYKVCILFFKAVASFWMKYGDWGHIEYTIRNIKKYSVTLISNWVTIKSNRKSSLFFVYLAPFLNFEVYLLTRFLGRSEKCRWYEMRNTQTMIFDKRNPLVKIVVIFVGIYGVEVWMQKQNIPI